MKVHELIEGLQKCDQMAEVEFSYDCDNVIEDGTSITDVVQVSFVVRKKESKDPITLVVLCG